MKIKKNLLYNQIIAIVVFLFCTNSIAQIQWANNVIDVSSFYKTGTKTQFLVQKK